MYVCISGVPRTPFFYKFHFFFFLDFRFLPKEKSVIKCLYGCH